MIPKNTSLLQFLFLITTIDFVISYEIWDSSLEALEVPFKRQERSFKQNTNDDNHWTDNGAQYKDGVYDDILSYKFDAEKPAFLLDHSNNVTGLLGKTAVLNCRVRNIGNKTVSWVRERDIHLLTVGRFSYTSDQRFTAVHSEGSEDWLMKIHYLQERDAGWYECQVSSTPPVSHRVYLSVVEPETVIVGGPDVYINTGSRLALTCSVKYSPTPPAFIFWYHNDKLVSYDRGREGVRVSTEKGHVTTSRLLVQYAEQRHSGKYKCAPANSRPKGVMVHVLAGEPPRAIQKEDNVVAPNNKANLMHHNLLNILSLLSSLYTLNTLRI